MKIELGRTYLTRDSRIIEIVKTSMDPVYPYEGIERLTGWMHTYTSLGEINKGHGNLGDLVSVYPPFYEEETPITKTIPTPIKAATDKVDTGLILIPLYSLLNLGAVFIEGLRYGRDNWRKGVNDKEYQEERLEHALLHLIKYKEGDRSEEHLAKVMWFCTTQLELERLEKLNGAN